MSLELLTGLTWQLNELDGNPTLPLPEAAVTANFDEEGRMSGSASCNNYTAPYEIDGGFRNDVLFPGGMILEESGEVKIYYGAADTVECLATADVGDLLDLCEPFKG